MAYIGKTPTVGSFIKLDDITTSSTNSYTMQHNSVNFSPESANHMLVSLNGVIQAPNTSFSVSGSTITFLPSSGTLSSSDSIDFIMVYGNVLDVGVASSVADSAITKGKLNLISDSSSAGLTVKGDGSSENGTIQLNCSQNSHGVKISSPAHSAGQSYELILPTGNVTADKVLKVASVSGSGTTGIGQLSFGDAGGNTPSFAVTNTSDQTFSINSSTKITFNSEILDSDGAFASNKFTVPSGQAGKYFVGFRYGYKNASSDFTEYLAYVYKNGSEAKISARQKFNSSYMVSGATNRATAAGIIDLAVSDYLELYVLIGASGGTPTSTAYQTEFFGFKIG